MKLIVVMTLEQYRDSIRKIFEKQEVHFYSEIEIVGHTLCKMRSWWTADKDLAVYSNLYFAVIPKEKADEIMAEIAGLAEESGEEHPPRAFQVNVEKMV